MIGYLLAALAFIGGLGMTAVGDLVSEEVRDRLDHLPHAILRVAARRLDPAVRVTVYEDEWLPELTYILKGDEARPVTRLIHGTRYAVGILMSAHRISRHLRPSASERRGLWLMRFAPLILILLSPLLLTRRGRAWVFKALEDAISQQLPQRGA